MVLAVDLLDYFEDGGILKRVDYSGDEHWIDYICECQQDKISVKLLPNTKIKPDQTPLEPIEIKPINDYISAGVCDKCKIVYYVEFQ